MRNRKLFIFINPFQPLGTFGGKVALEVRKWTEEGWRVRLLFPKKVKNGNKTFPKSGWFLDNGVPKQLLRETVSALCSRTRK